MAFTLCAGITADTVYDCTNPLKGGAREEVRLFNYQDLYPEGTLTIAAGIVTDIVLDTGAQAFKFSGFNRSMRPKYELVRGAFSVGYKHTIDLLVFQKDDATKKNLEALAMTKVVAVVNNIDENDDMGFEVYGLDGGLELVSNTMDLNDSDSNGAWVLQLATPDLTPEGRMPYTWFDTDAGTTLTNVQLLDTPTP